jgi:hypothetical protein
MKSVYKDEDRILKRLMKQSPWTKRKAWVKREVVRGDVVWVYWWHVPDSKWGSPGSSSWEGKWNGTLIRRFFFRDGGISVYQEKTI